MIPIADQVHWMRTSLDVSEAVYPLDVQRGKLSQEACDKEIAMMAAVLKTLEWCERNKPLIVELRKAERRAD